ncbi:hypothetical protein ICW40_00615 [Actinotalea ferrariae]|uniref:hypothetical protein n=1 Tax=Actinotalea ferrariae TaxID=1386098 RepID=UPI001C8B0AD8|nr:hypothetical protein [Actinotalea ferrariae]MBX9243311.1 hypothetical protein [Actinotalea ferrariae]
MRTEGWVVLGLTLLIGPAMIAGAVALSRKESRVRRIQLPARLVEKTHVISGYMLTVEFPGPDNEPRRTVLFSAIRRGIGATPEFQGWVWVNRDDPSDVIVRPRARSFWPVFLTIAGSVVLVAGFITTAVILGLGALDDLPTQS